ncbi:fatty acid desaturase family protein [Nocardia tengchongensis]|uniref:fatty acid desaturase family protein n=1 Tax=Nocardia tengchongensis TaxID=2055889 RepID=UPI00360C6C38
MPANSWLRPRRPGHRVISPRWIGSAFCCSTFRCRSISPQIGSVDGTFRTILARSTSIGRGALMAITDVAAYTHLTSDDVREFGDRLEEIRRSVEQDLGDRDARYIRNLIRVQRTFEVGARLVLLDSGRRSSWWLGTGLLFLSKVIENMEIGHNVLHGQWDWMNDPEIHSSVWEWDHPMPAAHWKKAHNYQHHVFANVIGMDPDEGYGLLRVTRDRRWRPYHLGNAVYVLPVSMLYEFGMCIYHLEIPKVVAGRKDPQELRGAGAEILRKASKQVFKDYVAFPALSMRNWKSTVRANLTANVAKNMWEQIVTFCGHFPDGAEKFTRRDLATETRGEWYLRQFLGSANFPAGPVGRILTGSLGYQIEHHLFPDLPSNRLPDVAPQVRDLAEQYGLPYTCRSIVVQYLLTLRTIVKLSLPDRFLRLDADSAPETTSEFASERRAHASSGRR